MRQRWRNWNVIARLLLNSSIRSGRASPSLVDAGSWRVLGGRRPKGAGQVEVRVADHQVETGESVRVHAQRRMAEITKKYFSRAVGANVTFGRAADNGFSCDIVAPVMRGVVLKASHSAREPQMAFNGAADRIEKQLRRYMSRLKAHEVDETAQAYVENADYT